MKQEKVLFSIRGALILVFDFLQEGYIQQNLSE